MYRYIHIYIKVSSTDEPNKFKNNKLQKIWHVEYSKKNLKM